MNEGRGNTVIYPVVSRHNSLCFMGQLANGFSGVILDECALCTTRSGEIEKRWKARKHREEDLSRRRSHHDNVGNDIRERKFEQIARRRPSRCASAWHPLFMLATLTVNGTISHKLVFCFFKLVLLGFFCLQASNIKYILWTAVS